MINPQQVKVNLSVKQKLKLDISAKILKTTAAIYVKVTPHELRQSLLPLWAAGVITHAQPNAKHFIVGITESAKKSPGKDCTRDHLFRVTATAEFILSKAGNLTEDQIQDILIERSIKMITTKVENNRTLQNALSLCENKDDWQELYRVAGVKYELYEHAQSESPIDENLAVTGLGDLQAKNKEIHEVTHGDYTLQEMESGTICLQYAGTAVTDSVIGHLRRIANELGIPLLNDSGNNLNTRQLGSKIIKQLQSQET